MRWPLLAGGGAVIVWLLACDAEGYASTKLLRGLATLGVVAMLVLSLWQIVQFVPRYWADTADYGLFGRPGAVIDRLSALCLRYPKWTATWGATAAIAALIILWMLAGWSAPPKAGLGPWTGDFLAQHRINSLANNQTGIPLGWDRNGAGRRLLRYVPGFKRNWTAGHHCVIAGTRAGKGIGCVIPAILDHQGPVAVLDVKGENLAVCGRARAKMGRRQVILNPFGLYDVFQAKDPKHLLGQPVYGWDPLSYVRRGTVHMQRDIETLIDGLIVPEVGENAWISNGAKRLLSAFAEYVLTTQSAPTLLTIIRAVMASDRMTIVESWKGSNLCGGRLDEAAGEFLGMSDKSLSPILSWLSDNLKWAQLECCRVMIENGKRWSIDELLDDKADLWVLVPMDQLGTMRGFVRLLVSLTLGTITRQDGKRMVKKPILAVLDEFTRLGRMDKVLEIATVAAGSGVEALFVTQDRGSLDAVYGEAGASTIIGSCATTRVFGLGRGDAHTAEWLERTMRNMTIQTSSQRGQESQKSDAKDKLLAAADLLELPKGQALCLIRDHAPVKLWLCRSYQDAPFRERCDPNPTARL